MAAYDQILQRGLTDAQQVTFSMLVARSVLHHWEETFPGRSEARDALENANSMFNDLETRSEQLRTLTFEAVRRHVDASPGNPSGALGAMKTIVSALRRPLWKSPLGPVAYETWVYAREGCGPVDVGTHLVEACDVTVERDLWASMAADWDGTADELTEAVARI